MVASRRWVTCSLAVVLELLLGSSSRADSTEVHEPRRGVYSFQILAGDWEPVHRLRPERSGFTPPFEASVDRRGWGISLVYHHRVRTGRPELHLGGELEGLINGSSGRYAGTWAGSGAAVIARMYTNVGQVTAGARLVWPRSRQRWHVGAGAGLYMLQFKDVVAGMVTETGVGDAAPGGYVVAGTDRLFRQRGLGPMFKGGFGIRSELKLHAFRFRDLGAAFPGQSAGGPMVTLSLGLVSL